MADIAPIVSLNGEIAPTDSLTGELAMPEKVWMQGPPGPQGPKGDPGAAATVTVGTVTTGEPGTDAIVTNSGTESAAVLDFIIPRGETGAVGAAGADGVSPTVSTSKSGNVTTITIVDAVGTKTATINDGAKGDTGPAGPAGAGVPDGGTAGQLLGKTESGTAWIDPPQSGVQPDWNQNDEMQPDYVKNRTHWKEIVETLILAEQTISGQAQVTLENGFHAEGDDCIVVWDGVEYNQKVKALDASVIYVGNLSISGQGEDTGEPFVVASMKMGGVVTTMVVAKDGGEHVVKVVWLQNTYHKIPSEYLDDRVYNYTTDITSVDDFHAELKKIENAMKTDGKFCFYSGDPQHSGPVMDVNENYLLVASVFNGSIYMFDYEGWHGFPETHYIETEGEWKLGYINGIQSVPVYARIPSSGNQVVRKPFVLYSDRDTAEPYGTGIILKSSTSGSSKLFNITVDDTGSLKATEVT